jgi:uncharacterized OB-fold protein
LWQSQIGARPQGKTCDAIMGLLDEGKEIKRVQRCPSSGRRHAAPNKCCELCVGARTNNALAELTFSGFVQRGFYALRESAPSTSR